MISSLPGLAHEILQRFFLLFPDINWFILSTWLLFVLLSCLNWVVYRWSFLPRRAVHGEPLVPELLLGTELHVARGHGCMCGSNRIKMDQVWMDQKWALHIFWGSMINGNLGKFTCIKVTLICFWMTSHNVNTCISWEIAAMAATSQDLKVPSIIALAGDDHIVRSPGTATAGLATAIIQDRPWSRTIATEKDHLSDATEKNLPGHPGDESRPENQIPSAYLT